jgi:hypothetical protein
MEAGGLAQALDPARIAEQVVTFGLVFLVSLLALPVVLAGAIYALFTLAARLTDTRRSAARSHPDDE